MELLLLFLYALIGCWIGSILFFVPSGIRAIREIRQEQRAEQNEQRIIQLAEQVAQDYLDQLA